MTLAFQPLPAPDSPLRCLDPRWKLAGVFLLLVSSAFLRQPWTALTALVIALLLVWVGQLPRRWYLVRMVGLILFLSPFLLLLPFLMPLEESVILGGVLTTRAVTVVSLVLVLLTSAPLNDLLKAAHALRVPGLLVQLFALTSRYVHLIAGELSRIRIALRARGYRNTASQHSYRTIGHVTGTLLVRSHDRGERVAQAMRCRGFEGQYRSLANFQSRWWDVLFFLLLAGLALGLLVWDLLARGVL